MASGVLFPFAPGKEQRLVRAWRKKQGFERYAHFFKLSRKEGIQTVFQSSVARGDWGGRASPVFRGFRAQAPDEASSRSRHSRNIAAWPHRRPAPSVRFQTVARAIANRRPAREIRTPE
jgi:hypothetical protein